MEKVKFIGLLFLLAILLMPLIFIGRANGPEEVPTTPTKESVSIPPTEEELIDPDEWFVTDTQPTQFPTEFPTEPPTEPESQLIYLGYFRLTAYCPCVECNGEWPNQTSTGVTPRPNHTIAVDPTVIPYGTTVIINGIEYVAEDCGASIKEYSIDVFFATHEECSEFGVRYADVYMKPAAEGKIWYSDYRPSIMNEVTTTVAGEEVDVDFLAKLLFAEAAISGWEGKVFTCSAILNLCDNYNISLWDAGHDINYFAVADQVDEAEPTKDIYEVIDYVLNGGRIADICYFRTKHYHSFGIPVCQIDGQYFSKP